MTTAYCPHCEVTFVLTADGRCPSCTSPVAKRFHSDYQPQPRRASGIVIASCLAALVCGVHLAFLPNGHHTSCMIAPIMFSVIFTSFPLHDRRWGTAIVGFIALTMICAAIGLSVSRRPSFHTDAFVLLLTGGVCIASGYAVVRPLFAVTGFFAGTASVAAALLLGWATEEIWPAYAPGIRPSTAATLLLLGPVVGGAISLPIHYLEKHWSVSLDVRCDASKTAKASKSCHVVLLKS